MEDFIERILNLIIDGTYNDNIGSGLVLNRLTGGKNVKSSKLDEKVSWLYNNYCFDNNPECGLCPVNNFCEKWRTEQKNKMTNSIPFIDLFCGAGGLSIGIEKFNFHPILAIDKDKSAAKTYLFNRPFLKNDQVLVNDIENIVNDYNIPTVPLVIGGPPCQGFSNANRQKLSDDPRNFLYKFYIEFVKKANAKVCIMENVTGMLNSQQAVENDFSDIGFFIKPCLFNTKDFGYPQNRSRVFWFGLKTKDEDKFERVYRLFKSTLNERLVDNQFTLQDAISDLPKLEAKTIKNNTKEENDKWGYTIGYKMKFKTPYCKLINGNEYSGFLYNHKTKYNNERDIQIYSLLKQGEKSDADSIQEIMPYKNRNHIFKDKFYKLIYSEPCKTITAHMYYDCHMYIHPNQARGLTPREAARVQGFPDNYFFNGTPNEWYRQIGNAVSPLAATHVGKALEEIFKRFGEDLL